MTGKDSVEMKSRRRKPTQLHFHYFTSAFLARSELVYVSYIIQIFVFTINSMHVVMCADIECMKVGTASICQWRVLPVVGSHEVPGFLCAILKNK